jgi:hypothetical protein
MDHIGLILRDIYQKIPGVLADRLADLLAGDDYGQSNGRRFVSATARDVASQA